MTPDPPRLEWRTGLPLDEAITIYPPTYDPGSVEALLVGLATHGRKRARRERAMEAVVGAVREAVTRHA